MFKIGESTARVITGHVNLEWFKPILEKYKEAWVWQLVGQFNQYLILLNRQSVFLQLNKRIRQEHRSITDGWSRHESAIESVQ
jgi:hypothetical protein